MIDKAALQEKIAKLQALLDNQDTAYDYEKVFDETWSQIGREDFEKALGKYRQTTIKKRYTLSMG